jgi:hypothetical protein
LGTGGQEIVPVFAYNLGLIKLIRSKNYGLHAPPS